MNLNKILEYMESNKMHNNANNLIKKSEENFSYDCEEEDVIYEIPRIKRKVNNIKLLKLKKGKRSLYNRESGPIYYYYSINNNIYKLTIIKKYSDYEDCRYTYTQCKQKENILILIY